VTTGLGGTVLTVSLFLSSINPKIRIIRKIKAIIALVLFVYREQVNNKTSPTGGNKIIIIQINRFFL
jgi:hypothetical protein